MNGYRTCSGLRRGHRFGLRQAPLAAALLFAFSACDDLLEVTDPDIIEEEGLQDPAGLDALRNGSLADFNLAFTGGGSSDGQTMIAGLMSDEWMHSGTFPTRQEVELRSITRDNTTMNGVYLRMHQARAGLESAAEIIGASVEDASADERIPELLAHAGYTYVAFAENYCSGVPVSRQTQEGELEFGNPQTTSETLMTAIARFDEVIAHPAASPSIADMARVGKGRALLDLGQFDGAASAVAAVPDDFVRFTQHSDNADRERNGVFELNFTVRRWTVGDLEGDNGLDFRSADDPRVQWAADSRGGFDGSSPLFIFEDLSGRADPAPIASGLEARLIEAEAALQSAATGTWLGILNGLRADADVFLAALYPNTSPSGTLAPLADPGTPAGREDLMFRERAFWLYATNHRLGDMRRLIRQYGRDANAVFPTGPYFKEGASYGNDVNFPIPQDEENNPNFTNCLDRDA